MKPVARVVRWTLSLVFAVAAAACIVRGMTRLFQSPRPGQVAAFDGVTPALGYFALGVGLLIVAGELSPKPPPAPPAHLAPPAEGGAPPTGGA